MFNADSLIADLNLQPHPEGGYYGEVFRSKSTVLPQDGRGARSALTTIHFLLMRGQVSRFHKVTSDEVWHFYEGDPLRLTLADEKFNMRSVILGSLDSPDDGHARSGQAAVDLHGDRGGHRRVHVVPAGSWQAAEPLGEYALVGCTVGPGFDFADFTMMKDDEAVVQAFEATHPTLWRLV